MLFPQFLSICSSPIRRMIKSVHIYCGITLPYPGGLDFDVPAPPGNLLGSILQSVRGYSHLLEGKVRRVVGGRVCYVHMLFDQHEIVETDGALSESLYIGTQSLQTLPSASIAEILELFPDLKARVGREPMARQVARSHEAALLVSA